MLVYISIGRENIKLRLNNRLPRLWNLVGDLVLSSTVRMEIVTFPDDLHENYCHFLLKQKIAQS